MSFSDYWILDGKVPVPASLEDWGKWLNANTKRVAATTTEDGQWVSTVFLGLDHQYGEGPPLLFETMVFPSKDDWGERYMERYSTWELALEGHERAVEWAKAHAGVTDE